MGVFDYVWGRWTALFLAPVYNHSDDNPIRLLASLNRRQWGYFLVSSYLICTSYQNLIEILGWPVRLGVGRIRFSHCNHYLLGALQGI